MYINHLDQYLLQQPDDSSGQLHGRIQNPLFGRPLYPECK